MSNESSDRKSILPISKYQGPMTSRFSISQHQAGGPSTFDSRSVHERIYDEIRIGLSQGVFSEGQTLTTRGLAATFGTSEMPVREAIRRLVAEKYIVQSSNRSFQVPQLNSESFRDVISVRLVLEGFAAARAAGKAKPADIEVLREVNDRMRAAIEAQNAQDTLRLNEEFHFSVYALTESGTLLETIETLWSRSGPYLASVMGFDSSMDVFHQAAQMHDRIIAAIEAQDDVAAQEALVADISFAVKWYEDRKGYSDPPG